MAKNTGFHGEKHRVSWRKTQGFMAKKQGVIATRKTTRVNNAGVRPGPPVPGLPWGMLALWCRWIGPHLGSSGQGRDCESHSPWIT